MSLGEGKSGKGGPVNNWIKKKGYLSHKMVFFNSIVVPISRLSE